jgi:hypothetical protein
MASGKFLRVLSEYVLWRRGVVLDVTGGVKYGCIASSDPVNRRLVALSMMCDDPKSDN